MSALSAQIARFGLVGLGTTALYFVLTLLFERLLVQWPGAAVSFFAYVICGAVSYLGHRIFTFRSTQDQAGEITRFAASFALGLAISLLLPGYLHDRAGYPLSVAAFGVAIAVPVLNYILLSRFVFARPAGASKE